jgi:hypothetical protein
MFGTNVPLYCPFPFLLEREKSKSKILYNPVNPVKKYISLRFCMFINGNMKQCLPIGSREDKESAKEANFYFRGLTPFLYALTTIFRISGVNSTP